MSIILGIETSCDETASAIYDSTSKKILSSVLFSQVAIHEAFGGVVPELASRSHLEKIDLIVQKSLSDADVALDEVDVVAITNKPGLVGSLLIGLCFGKSVAWAKNKKLVGVNHLEGHIFSAFLGEDMHADLNMLPFPHLSLSVSGGHTSFYLVEGFGDYKLIGQTIDDAAGEAFDKIGYILGLGYPGGPAIEKLAREASFEDFFKYTRGKGGKKDLNFSFSGLKTAVMYDLINRGVFDIQKGLIKEKITHELKVKVASSLQVCITDILEERLRLAFKLYPQAQGFSFVGGVACNLYTGSRLQKLCDDEGKRFVVTPRRFCTDNAAMIAFVGAYKAEQGEFAPLSLDVFG